MKNSVQILNLGCGEITHPRFVNVDNDIVLKLKAWGFIPVKSTGQQKRLRSDVTFLDISKGLPFKDESFDIVFHSHVLEHIPFDQRDSFMAENFRLIKKGGALRMVIPD